ncbi:MAG: FAD-binding protein, partial [Promicromonosporaceae bacterium]|nr:FAD-binding protein [Promicromonosporaceae bacterium]
MSSPTLLADLTTLRVGGPARRYVAATTEAEIIAAVADADSSGEPVLILGTGSNMLVGDAGFPGVVVHDARTDIAPEITFDDAAGTSPGAKAQVTAVAGRIWDQLV